MTHPLTSLITTRAADAASLRNALKVAEETVTAILAEPQDHWCYDGPLAPAYIDHMARLRAAVEVRTDARYAWWWAAAAAEVDECERDYYDARNTAERNPPDRIPVAVTAADPDNYDDDYHARRDFDEQAHMWDGYDCE